MKAVFWHRRDLRIDDNHGLSKATLAYNTVVPIFIFDEVILDNLPEDDKRVQFIYQSIKELKEAYQNLGSDLLVFKGKPEKVFQFLAENKKMSAIYTNRDYEPYGMSRDTAIGQWASKNNIDFQTFKDHVIFEKDEINIEGRPYKVYTPFSKKWKQLLTNLPEYSINSTALSRSDKQDLPSLKSLGFIEEPSIVPAMRIDDSTLNDYHLNRNIPCKEATSNLSVYLRFGNVSIRKIVQLARSRSEVFLNELIWREFFMTILWYYPNSVTEELKPQYRGMLWQKNDILFKAWCQGQTGFPIVDAGMRQLNKTGLMHNRVRMITASFLVKHLLIDWRLGEAYFAEKLLDFELSSNIGNWQWVAGTGTDAAPYFRIFNPKSQQEKFDPDFKYIKKWVEEFGTSSYPEPIVDHKLAREKALTFYKSHLYQ